MPACPRCGGATGPADRFCAHCGAPLPAGPAEGTGIADGIEHTGAITSIIARAADTSGTLGALGPGTREDLPEGSAVLLVLRGPGEGTEFALAADVVGIGRSPQSEVFLDDVTVSRRHAEIRRNAGGWSVRDAGSLNGTYVNRVRVEDAPLRPGDELQVGKFRFAFLVGAGRGPSAR